MATVPAPLIYRVDDLELDTARGVLSRGGQEIHLKPKAFHLLVYLLAERDRLVSREELLERFWKDTAVTDDVLAQAIAELRRALGDNSREPLYLKTIPKRGFRFVGDVQEIRSVSLIATEQTTTIQLEEEYSGEPASRHRRWWFFAAGLVVAAAVFGLYSRLRPATPPTGKQQVAVFRFENRSGQGDLDWLRDGLPDMLATTLSRSPALNVLSREQVASWLGTNGPNGLKGAIELAKRNRARTAVVGSFARIGDSIRIDAQIYAGDTGSLLAAESITAQKQDQILNQVDFLAARLAARLAAKAPVEDTRALSSLMTNNLEAYRYYALGLRKTDSFETKEAIELFEKALALDANFVMAHARIGYAYTVNAVSLSNLAQGRPYLEKAFQMAGRLTEKDRRHIVAWYAIANQDYEEAIRRYSELIALYPNEYEPYYRLGRLLRGESRHEQAADTLRRALSIHPDERKLWNALAAVYSEMGMHREAVEMAQRYVALTPADANAFDSLGLAYQFAGAYDQALESFAKALAARPDFDIVRLHRGQTYAQMGRIKDALEEFRHGVEAARNDEVRVRFWGDASWLHWRRGNMGAARSAFLKAHPDRRENEPHLNVAELTLVKPGSQAALAPMAGRGARYGLRIQYFYQSQKALLEHHQDEMLSNLREALRHKPSWGGAEPLEDALGDAYLNLGRFDEAIAEYDRALKLFPGMALARFHLAEAYQRKGDAASARPHFQAFLDQWKHADADLPEIAEARRWLR